VATEFDASLVGPPGVDVRVAGREPQRLTDRWPGVDAVELDVMRPETIGPAREGITTAYYLIHSMEEGGSPFEERDRTGATNFARAAAKRGVERIVFLGGLGDDEDPDLSPHLASRHETGRLLAEHGPAVLELRAGIVIGAGSASFRMLEDLVRRLPVMVTPRWVDTRSQPIAIDDVVTYLDEAREATLDEHHTIVEIGGADVLSYREMMRRLGAIRGRVPLILPVPVLSPSLSSLWCGLVTSVPPSIARPLIEGQRNETVVRDDTAVQLFPDPSRRLRRSRYADRLIQLSRSGSTELRPASHEHPLDHRPRGALVLRLVPHPREGVGGDLRERPAVECPVGLGPLEHDAIAGRSRDEVHHGAGHRREPRHQPRAARGVIQTHRRPVLGGRRLGPAPFLERWAEQHVLDGTAFEDPAEMPLAATLGRLIARVIEVRDLEIPRADEPAEEHQLLRVSLVRSGGAQEIDHRGRLTRGRSHGPNPT
jgi:uncharacterized protein YbjT (DUF2867 family)